MDEYVMYKSMCICNMLCRIQICFAARMINGNYGCTKSAMIAYTIEAESCGRIQLRLTTWLCDRR